MEKISHHTAADKWIDKQKQDGLKEIQFKLPDKLTTSLNSSGVRSFWVCGVHPVSHILNQESEGGAETELEGHIETESENEQTAGNARLRQQVKDNNSNYSDNSLTIDAFDLDTCTVVMSSEPLIWSPPYI